MRTFTVVDMLNKVSMGGCMIGNVITFAMFTVMNDCGEHYLFIDEQTDDMLEVTNESDYDTVQQWIDEHMGDE